MTAPGRARLAAPGGGAARFALPVGVRLAVPPLLRATAPWLLAVTGATAVVFAAISAGIAIWADPGSSVWGSVGWVLQWVAFGGGIALAGCLPVLVAHGLTRRSVATAGALVLLGLAAGLAVIVQLGFGVEWLAHRATGWPYTLDGARLFDGIGQVHLVLAEYTLMFAAFLVTGWLVVAVFQRLGWWRGSLAVPLAFLPAAAGLAALSAGWVGDRTSEGGATEADWPWTGTVGVPLSLALAAAAVAAGLLAIRALTRSVPVPRR